MLRSLLIVLLVACPAPPRAPQRPPSNQLPDWMIGVTIREGVTAKNMAGWMPKHVFVVQAPVYVGDVRVPHARPTIRAHSFEELSDEELDALGTQWGFVGKATIVGDVMTWAPEIAYAPPSDELDTARVERVGANSVDEHIDDTTVEHWWRISSGDGRFLALELRQGARLERFLVVTGDHFVYARNRSRDLPKAESLPKLFEATHASRADKIAMLDCELSYGLVRGGSRPWEILHSTLPWREGASLELPPLEVRGGTLVARDGQPGSWTIGINTMSASDLAVMFRADASPR